MKTIKSRKEMSSLEHVEHATNGTTAAPTRLPSRFVSRLCTGLSFFFCFFWFFLGEFYGSFLLRISCRQFGCFIGCRWFHLFFFYFDSWFISEEMSMVWLKKVWSGFFFLFFLLTIDGRAIRFKAPDGPSIFSLEFSFSQNLHFVGCVLCSHRLAFIDFFIVDRLISRWFVVWKYFFKMNLLFIGEPNPSGLWSIDS